MRDDRLSDRADPDRRCLLDQCNIFVANGYGCVGLVGQLDLSATLGR